MPNPMNKPATASATGMDPYSNRSAHFACASATSLVVVQPSPVPPVVSPIMKIGFEAFKVVPREAGSKEHPADASSTPRKMVSPALAIWWGGAYSITGSAAGDSGRVNAIEREVP